MADIVQAALGLERAKAGARMAKSDISGFTDPIQKQVSEITERNKEARKNFVSNIPDNYEFDLIPAEAKAKLTTFLKDKKQEYIDFADQASRYSGNTSSQEYIDAVEGMENVKAAMNKNYEDLVLAKQIRQYEVDNETLGTVGFVGDENADSRRTAIIDGSTFNNIEFTDDGAFINDGFGEKIAWNKYDKTPVRKVEAAKAFADLKSDVGKLSAAGRDKKTVRDVVETELGFLFQDSNFVDEIYNMGFYGDVRGKTVYKNIPGATKENMFDFFVDMVMNDSYVPPISDGQDPSFDAAPGFNSLEAAGQVKLSSLTGKDEDKYNYVVYNEKIGKYEIRKGGEALETGFKPMTMNELREFVGLQSGKEQGAVPFLLDPESKNISVEEQAKNLINLYK